MSKEAQGPPGAEFAEDTEDKPRFLTDLDLKRDEVATRRETWARDSATRNNVVGSLPTAELVQLNIYSELDNPPPAA